MDTLHIYDLIKSLELALDGGFQIIQGFYTICNKHEILNLIEKIHENLPIELVQAKSNVIKSAERNVFDHLDNLYAIVQNSFCIIPDKFVILPNRKLLELIDYIYADLPVNIQIARSFSKS